jgi:hypothetical protein
MTTIAPLGARRMLGKQIFAESHYRRRALLVLIAIAASWALILTITGGFRFDAPWGSVSSRDPKRPLVVALLIAGWYYARYREHWATDLNPLLWRQWPEVIAAAAAAGAVFVGVRWGSFVAGGSDSAGYVSQAAMWLRGELTMPVPEWVVGAPWPNAVWTSTPLGYCPSQTAGVLAPQYSPGLPMIMAVFQAVSGPQAVYYVVPLLGAVAVWATWRLGSMLGGRWAGAMASLLLLTSPAFLFMVVQPMSDVPVAAFWAVAVIATSSPGFLGPLGAGAATSIAVLIRPNLVPLGGIVAMMLYAAPGGLASRFRRVLLFAMACAPSLAAIAWLNWFWHGSPLRSGYGPFDYLYSLDRVLPNLQKYWGWLLESQTPLVLLAVGAPLVHRRTGSISRVALVTVVFPVVVLALYLPYLVFDTWSYLRFLLPGYPMLLAAVSAVVVVGMQRMSPPPVARIVVTAITLGFMWYGLSFARSHSAFRIRLYETRYVSTAEYIKRVPDRSILMALHHSGSIRYYTGRDVFRWDWLEPKFLDTAVRSLRGRAYNVYLVADAFELEEIRRRFASTLTLNDLDDRNIVRLPGGVVVYPLGGSDPLPPGRE